MSNPANAAPATPAAAKTLVVKASEFETLIADLDAAEAKVATLFAAHEVLGVSIVVFVLGFVAGILI